MNSDTAQLVSQLTQKQSLLASKTALIGFDGFIDTIVKIVREKNVMTGDFNCFSTKQEFAEFLLDLQGKNCSLQLKELDIKMGGNAPILANAMAHLGTSVDCIAAVGLPAPDRAFKSISQNCRLHSFAEPGRTVALEFNDGKVMLAVLDPISNIKWNHLKNAVGFDEINRMFRKSDFIALVNWSEMDHCNDIWDGILKEIAPGLAREYFSSKKTLLIDFADFGSREKTDVLTAFEKLKAFSHIFDVVLSLNENEAVLMAELLGFASEAIAEIGAFIHKALGTSMVVIHNSKHAMAWTQEYIYKEETFFVESPKISTGSGDNFNAGLSTALLLGLDLNLALKFANAVACCYIGSGKSPSMDEVIGFLKELHL